MRLSWIIWIFTGISILGCTGNSLQEQVDKWNAEFVAKRSACESGNLSACRDACQMSMERRVCVSVKQSADMSNPKWQAWVEKCEQDAAFQGRSSCAAAGIAEPTGSAPKDAAEKAPTVEAQAERLRKELEDHLKTIQAEVNKTAQEEEDLGRRLTEAAEAVKRASADPAAIAMPEPSQETPPASVESISDKKVVHGALAQEVILRIIRGHQAALRKCYEDRLAVNSSLSGKVTVKFTISADGTVSKVAISESTLKDPRVEKCVSQVFTRMVFPSFEGDAVVVNYPLQFTSNS